MLRNFLSVTKALADENRLRLLLALRRRELCVCQLTELLGLAMSTVSKHLAILHQARLVTSRKNGRWIYYSLPGREAPAAARQAVAWVRKSLAADPRTVEDGRRLKKVLAIDPAALCRKLCRN